MSRKSGDLHFREQRKSLTKITPAKNSDALRGMIKYSKISCSNFTHVVFFNRTAQSGLPGFPGSCWSPSGICKICIVTVDVIRYKIHSFKMRYQTTDSPLVTSFLNRNRPRSHWEEGSPSAWKLGNRMDACPPGPPTKESRSYLMDPDNRTHPYCSPNRGYGP